MEKEFKLSEKLVSVEYVAELAPHFPAWFRREDVKEFIKRLKEFIKYKEIELDKETENFRLGQLHAFGLVNIEIDKLSGDL